MKSKQRQITRLLRHLQAKPGDNQARQTLAKLGYVPPAPPPRPVLSPAQFDAILANHYKPTDTVHNGVPVRVWMPATDEDAHRLGYGVAYILVKAADADRFGAGPHSLNPVERARYRG